MGDSSKEMQGKIAIVDPGLNIGVGSILYLFAWAPVLGVLQYSLFILSSFNGLMALFNLLPFMGFDDLEVFEWSKVEHCTCRFSDPCSCDKLFQSLEHPLITT